MHTATESRESRGVYAASARETGKADFGVVQPGISVEAA
jgi:hypothetical protein